MPVTLEETMMIGPIRLERRVFLACLAAILSMSAGAAWGQRIKIGFVVKQAEDPWFQTEWKFAQQAADADGFDLVKIPAPDAAKAIQAIDNLSAQGAQGLIICTPDVRLGPAIVAKCAAYNMKVMSVDDQFVGAGNKFMTDVHHLGISAHNIGMQVGKSLWDEMQKRGWKIEDTGVCVIAHDEVATHKERTDGAIEALKAAGFPADRIFKGSQKTTDVPGALDAGNIVLTLHPDVKHWLVCSVNDAGVLGAIRATEGHGFGAADVIGIGINGIDALAEFRKTTPTGFYGSILLQPKRHGYDTSDMMYHWIKDGTEPAKITYTDGILITRDNFEAKLKEQGLTN
jgi:L-arabinose transport system substrate-binding protein